MKDAYIKEVEKELRRVASREMQNEIVRDLNEIFSSALEHGETEAQVMERLGAPCDFVRSTMEQLGPSSTAPRRRRQLATGIVSLVIAAAAFSLLFAAGYRTVPANAIGYAEAMTGIQVVGTAEDLIPAMLVIGIIAAVTAIVQFVRLIREGGEKK